jgi:hypothetical protein
MASCIHSTAADLLPHQLSLLLGNTRKHDNQLAQRTPILQILEHCLVVDSGGANHPCPAYAI